MNRSIAQHAGPSPQSRRAALLEAGGHTGRPAMHLEHTVELEYPYGHLRIEESDAFVVQYLREDRLWEPGETATVADLLQPGMVFLDVGAHVGYYVVLASRLVGRDGLVVAFEPEERNFELLLHNIHRNGLANVVCFQRAASDSSGAALLYLATDNTGDHRLADDGGRATREIQTVALDDLPELAPVDVAKIDVQGFEYRALRGMASTLARSPAVSIAIEFWPYGLVQAGTDPVELLDAFRELGFELRLQDPDLPSTTPVDDAEIFKVCAEKSGLAHADLLLVRPNARASERRRPSGQP